MNLRKSRNRRSESMKSLSEDSHRQEGMKRTSSARSFQDVIKSSTRFRSIDAFHDSAPTSVTAVTDDSSMSSASTRGGVRRRERCVRFAMNPDGRVQCEVVRFQKCTDPTLWWNAYECEQIQLQCLKIIEENKFGPDSISGPALRYIRQGRREGYKKLNKPILFQMYKVPRVRGLERHIIESYDDIMRRHTDNVLRVQETANSEFLLRLASRQTSQAWEELAILRAQYDQMVVNKRRPRLRRNLSNRRLERKQSGRSLGSRKKSNRSVVSLAA